MKNAASSIFVHELMLSRFLYLRNEQIYSFTGIAIRYSDGIIHN